MNEQTTRMFQNKYYNQIIWNQQVLHLIALIETNMELFSYPAQQ